MIDNIKKWMDENLENYELQAIDEGIGINAMSEIMAKCFGNLEKEIEIDSIRAVASMECPVSGYIIESERSRDQLNTWANFLERIKEES